jgi:hypothetical protein
MPRLHIQEDVLDRYAMGTLEKESIAMVEEHMLECPLCQNRLAGADEFLTNFRTAAMQLQLDRSAAQPKTIWPHVRLLWAGAAAAVVLLAVLISKEPEAVRFAPPTVVMQSLRGPEAGVHVDARRPFLLAFDLTQPSTPAACEIVIVTTGGNEVLRTGAEVRSGRLTASINKLPRGSYWVRVFPKQGTRNLIAEYGLHAD